MKNKKYNYIFGPVPSRRLGCSLGIDVIPFKTCSYECIYCQLGRTTNKTTLRKEYIPLKDILKEIKLKLKKDMINLAKYFDGNVEIISDFNGIDKEKFFKVTKNEIINLLKRRPCSLDDLANGLKVHKNEVIKYLEQLIKNGKVKIDTKNNISFYFINQF